MAFTRRQFVQTTAAGAAGLWVASRGREASIFEDVNAFAFGPPSSTLILNSNENPVGPYKPVVDAVRSAFDLTNRYPFATVTEVTALIAAKYKVQPENVLLGTGSTQVLRTAIQVFTAKDRPLIGALPTFETPGSYAKLIGTPVTGVKLTPQMNYDLDAMAAASKGAGAVYLCNPNNPVPTATDGKSTRDFIATVGKLSPETTVLIDEAYFEYATMPGYETMIPIAAATPRVVVCRTFSKVYGMAGLRLGYAIGHRDTIKTMSSWDGPGTVSVLALAAARGAFAMDPKILLDERRRNSDVRAFTTKWFADRGYDAPESQANFIFVNVKRSAKSFRDACAKEGVLVGRDFPPFENSHSRITIGTMDEMVAATKVFERVLAAPAIAA